MRSAAGWCYVAFQWLERAYDSRSLSLEQVPSDPMFDPLREDPRFDELLARMGIETQPI